MQKVGNTKINACRNKKQVRNITSGDNVRHYKCRWKVDSTVYSISTSSLEVWKCLGWFGVVTICKLFNSIMITETIPSAWRDSVLVPIFKEKGYIQEYNNYIGINLLTHTFKMWERVLDRRVRECTDIHESQFGFMPERSTTDAIFILKQTIEQ